MFYSIGRKLTKIARYCYHLQVLYSLKYQLDLFQTGVRDAAIVQEMADQRLMELNEKWPDLFNFSGFYMTTTPQLSQELVQTTFNDIANQSPERIPSEIQQAEETLKLQILEFLSIDQNKRIRGIAKALRMGNTGESAVTNAQILNGFVEGLKVQFIDLEGTE